MNTNENTTTQKSFSEPYVVQYNMFTGPGPGKNARCLQRIFGEIKILNDEGVPVKTVGVLIASRAMLGAAARANIRCKSLFNFTRTLMRIGKVVYDFAAGRFSEALLAAYGGVAAHTDVLVLQRIELLPEYRSVGLGRLAIRDFYRNFSGGCCYVVAKCLPGQFDGEKVYHGEEDWRSQLGLSKFGLNRNKAKQALRQYLIKLGFDYLPQISTDFLFLNPRVEEMKGLKSRIRALG